MSNYRIHNTHTRAETMKEGRDWPCRSIPGTSAGWWWAAVGLGGPAACTCSPGGPGGFGKWGRGQRLQAVPPGQELESRRRWQRGPQLEPAGHCSWLWRGGNRQAGAGYWGGERRGGEHSWKNSQLDFLGNNTITRIIAIYFITHYSNHPFCQVQKEGFKTTNPKKICPLTSVPFVVFWKKKNRTNVPVSHHHVLSKISYLNFQGC